ncbi:AAA family ATPase [Paenibacillus sp. FSL H7-0331]|uniref:AAA family ATPase n=1 Tax=Paenibacillus sp. FSL H7-0331 TaxID=1920421 RepID=UPI00211660B1|nr:AAA family ATPase [Paenibacillus sp. FSL H7-0331]
MKRSFIAVTPGQLHREIELMRELHHLKPCVIVDEAPLLDREMLEEMRFLLNVRMDSESPMALMLVGQSELWDRLRMQAYTAIRQRIDVQCRLLHYDRAQTGEYIDRHLGYAASEQAVFSDSAVDAIYTFSSERPG